MQTKAKIREILLKKRKNLAKTKIKEKSKKILFKLANLKEYKKAKTVLFYHPIDNEVDTASLIKKELKSGKKQIALLRICGKTNRMHIHQITDLKDLKIGKFNIKEPYTHHPVIAKKDLNLIIVPGIAFDKSLNRIGYGKGYFDKLLKTLKCTKIALAYDFQIIENVPAEKHDQKVDIVITEKTILTKYFNANAKNN